MSSAAGPPAAYATQAELAALEAEVTPAIAELGKSVAALTEAAGLQDAIATTNKFFLTTEGIVKSLEVPTPLSMVGFFNAGATELQAESLPGSKAAEIFPASAITDSYLDAPTAEGTVTTGGVTRPCTTVDLTEINGTLVAGKCLQGSFPAVPGDNVNDFYLITGTPGAILTLAPIDVKGVPWPTASAGGKATFRFTLWDPVKNELIGGGGFNTITQLTGVAIPAGGKMLLIVRAFILFNGLAIAEAEMPYHLAFSVSKAGTFTKIALPQNTLVLATLALTLKLESNTAASGAVVLRVAEVEQLPGGPKRTLEDRVVYSISRAAAAANTLTVACKLALFLPEQAAQRYLEVAVISEPGLPGNATKYAWETFRLNIQTLATGPGI